MGLLPVVYQYQRALDEFRREGREPPLLKRMSELISLLDLTTTLNSSLPSDQILDAARASTPIENGLIYQEPSPSTRARCAWRRESWSRW